MNISTDLTVWIGAFLTISIFSFLYRDNPLFRFAESVFIGVSTGYIFCINVFEVLEPKLLRNLGEGRVIYLVPLLLGILLFFRNRERYRWATSLPLVFFVGIYTGLNLVVYAKGYVLDQALASMAPLLVFDSGGEVNMTDTFNSLLMMLGVVSVSVYFLNGRSKRWCVTSARNVGAIYLMVAFGAAFGYTVMARVSLLIGRLNFLFSDWLGIVK